MPSSDALPFQNFTVGIMLSWGDPVVYKRYVRWTNDVTVGGNVFSSEMRLEVQYGQDQGGAEDKPYTVTMPRRSPFDKMVLPQAGAPTLCTIYEFDPENPDSTVIVRWAGKLSKVVRNPAGYPSLVRAEVSGWRSLIQYPIGMQAYDKCNWALGDNGCKIDLAPKIQYRTVTDIENGIVVHLDSAPDPTWSYMNGAMYLDGVTVTIVAKDGVAGFKWWTDQPPPPTWVGQEIQVIPGCDGTPAVCDHFYSNIRRFMGFGIMIPDYNPNVGGK